MFNRECKVCNEKDKRINDLQKEVTYLREMASPAHLTVQLPRVHAEADAIISNAQDTAPSESEDDIEIREEAIRILTGTY